jgi:hypothetical protein
MVSAPPSHKGIAMDEKVFFEYDGVKVTNARFIVDGQTFAMTNVTSVKSHEQSPSRLFPILLLLFGLLCTASTPAVGIPIAGGAIFWLYKQRTLYHIMLRTSAGESSALKTYQRDYLNKVVLALNDAIVHRG